jgi:chromosome segregation protein
MTALTSQLEAAEERLADLDRQRTRLDEDRGEADRMTRDAAEALARLEREVSEGEAALAVAESAQPGLARALDDADRAARAAELALAQATAAQAGVEAEWRVAEAEVAAAETRLERLAREVARHADQVAALAGEGDPALAVRNARVRRDEAAEALAAARSALDDQQARKAELQSARDEAASALASARAELAGIEREHAALLRDREARARQAKGAHGLPVALDRVRAAPGYERALAAVLGRDAKAGLGKAPDSGEGRYWTGAEAPVAVPDSLAAHVTDCPSELAARLALVHCVTSDDGRALRPGE